MASMSATSSIGTTCLCRNQSKATLRATVSENARTERTSGSPDAPATSSLAYVSCNSSSTSEVLRA